MSLPPIPPETESRFVLAERKGCPLQPTSTKGDLFEKSQDERRFFPILFLRRGKTRGLERSSLSTEPSVSVGQVQNVPRVLETHTLS